MYKTFKRTDAERRNIAEIQIAKHINGPTGVIELFFDEEKARFRNLEKTLEVEKAPEESTPF